MAFQKMEQIKKRMPEWIASGLRRKEDIDLIEEVGKHIADARPSNRGDGYISGNQAVSTSQIRIAYGEITRLKMRYDPTAMMMLRPKLAYAAARNSGDTYNTLRDIIAMGINEVASTSHNPEQAFNNLASIFEAILAYHKAYGGK